MLVLVTYDVRTDTKEGRRRLRQVARACEDYGQRVQFSVFECDLDPALWVRLRARLVGLIDAEHDSLRFYVLGREWRRRVEHVGAKPSADPEGTLIV
ncbi:CRISPR-associated endonuclease Cas2 [Paracoccus luteus]|uniref:CRISPR-associated endonuclease Cas2 n=1 Tax=Paracoccus luteus TaxID=2508543 RepID=UPI00106F4D34|nr:CRISPR-associated endonuclease Cas2 [Paracoccus luteus]